MKTMWLVRFIILFSAIIIFGMIINPFTFEISHTYAQNVDENSTTFEEEYNIEKIPSVQWNYTYGSTADESANTLTRTTDRGFVLAGFRYKPSLNQTIPLMDIYLVKTNSNGALQWERVFDFSTNRSGQYSESEKALDVIQTFDGGFALVGESENDIVLLKTDLNGILEWNMIYEVPAGVNIDSELVQTDDGGFIMFSRYGSTMAFGPWGSTLIKTDSNGIVQWNQTYPIELLDETSTGDCDYNSFLQTNDGGFALVGEFNGYGDNYICLKKTDKNGVLEWNQKYYGDDYANAAKLIQTDDRGFAIIGSMAILVSDQPRSYQSIFLLKTDVDGIQQWKQNYGGSFSGEKFIDRKGYDIVETPSGDLILAGETSIGYVARSSESIDLVIVKTDNNGILQWDYQYEGPKRVRAIVLTTTGFAIAGSVTDDAGRRDMFLIMFNDPELNLDTQLIGLGVIIRLILLGTFLPAGIYLIKYRIFGRQNGFPITKKVKETINILFNGNSQKYLFLASGIKNINDVNKLDSELPKGLFEYKFLMQPVRISIMKLLNENLSMTSSELKNKLGLSWNEFTHHLPNMKKDILIHIEDQFVDGITKQTISITHEGRIQFETLVGLLQEFLSSTDFKTNPSIDLNLEKDGNADVYGD